jgi:hypothetical protein
VKPVFQFLLIAAFANFILKRNHAFKKIPTSCFTEAVWALKYVTEYLQGCGSGSAYFGKLYPLWREKLDPDPH